MTLMMIMITLMTLMTLMTEAQLLTERCMAQPAGYEPARGNPIGFRGGRWVPLIVFSVIFCATDITFKITENFLLGGRNNFGEVLVLIFP